MTAMASSFYLPAGGSESEYEVDVTPESAGWGYSSLRIISSTRPVSTASPPVKTRSSWCR